MTSRIEALERLGRLRAEGLLTEEEFAAEKARVLDPSSPAPEPEPLPNRGKANPSKTGGRETLVEPTGKRRLADDNDLLGPIQPIADEVDASLLVRRVWLVITTLLASEAMTAVNDVMTASSGNSWASTTTVSSATAGNVVGFAITFVVVYLLALWMARRASRVAAVILVIMAVSGMVWPFIEPQSGRFLLRLGAAVLSAVGLWYMVGVARGAFWLGGRRPTAFKPSPDRPSTLKAAWTEGRKQSAPVRRVFRWLAVGWLILFLAGGVWFYLRTRDAPTTATTATTSTTAPSDSQASTTPSTPTFLQPTPAEIAAGPTPAEQELRSWLIGAWVEEGGYCASYMALRLAESGQVLGEGLLGTWTVWPGRLDIRFQPTDLDGNIQGPAQQIAGAVRFIDANEFQLTEASGAVTLYRRCVGDVEPWRAPQAVTGGYHPLG